MAVHAVTGISHGTKKVANERALMMQGKRRRYQRNGDVCRRLSCRASRGTVTSHGLISAGQSYWAGMYIGVSRLEAFVGKGLTEKGARQ